MEDLKPVHGYEDKYAASIEGNIYNISYTPPRKLTPATNQKGYPVVLFYIKNKRNDYERSIKSIHRVVWEAFNGPIPVGQFVSFKDEDKTNTALSNLYLRSPKGLIGGTKKPVSITRVLPNNDTTQPYKRFFSTTSEAAKYLHLSNSAIAEYANSGAIIGWKIEYLKPK